MFFFLFLLLFFCCWFFFFFLGGGGHLFSLVVFFQNITLKTVGFLIIYQSFFGLEFGQRNGNVLFNEALKTFYLW